MPERLSGVLLHVSSLPGTWGKGDFGPEACRFIDWLEESGQSLWQILPLTYPDATGSPYTSPSANAINPGFLSPDMLRKSGLLSDTEWEHCLRKRENEGPALRKEVFNSAFGNWQQREDHHDFEHFCKDQNYWLHNTALFMTLRDHYGGTWYDFPGGLRDRHPGALEQWEREHAEAILRFKFEQFILFSQWGDIKSYAHSKGIRIIGDIPIFISGDSADVWAHRKIFKLDQNGFPEVWTGVPPDLFTTTGQLWAQPHYDWNTQRENNYEWWVERVRVGRIHADIIRIDHFRGFCAAYEVPFEAPTAQKGKWVDGPGKDIFRVLHASFPDLSIIAEDLGVITPDVTALRQKLGYPGMKILQFAFNGDSTNGYLPENFDKDDRFVVYTGTHDNDTTRGWYEKATRKEKKMLAHYTDCDASTVAWTLVEMAFHSNAMWAVIPMQDLLNLDGSARMNLPGTIIDNWAWQMDSLDLPSVIGKNLKTLTAESGRSR